MLTLKLFHDPDNEEDWDELKEAFDNELLKEDVDNNQEGLVGLWRKSNASISRSSKLKQNIKYINFPVLLSNHFHRHCSFQVPLGKLFPVLICYGQDDRFFAKMSDS